ncbi:hypothetical protein V8F06_001461, partial [Rhypophila decipiens]
MRDLQRQGKTRPSRLVGAATAVAGFRQSRTNVNQLDRGIGSSRPGDDSDWESASDDDDDSSSSDDYDPGLAYGSTPQFSSTYLPAAAAVVPAAMAAAAVAPSIFSERPQEAIRPPDRKSSAVDPALFGPVNSLRGYINTPCGYRPGENARSSTFPGVGTHLPHRIEEPTRHTDSASMEAQRPMQTVYPVATSDPTRFDASASVVSGPGGASGSYGRPDPVPIQAPKPRVPVSTRVLEEQRMEAERAAARHARKASDGSSSFVDTATVLGAGAAIAGAAAVLGSRDKRGDKYDDDKYDDRRREGKNRDDTRYDERRYDGKYDDKRYDKYDDKRSDRRVVEDYSRPIAAVSEVRGRVVAEEQLPKDKYRSSRQEDDYRDSKGERYSRPSREADSKPSAGTAAAIALGTAAVGAAVLASSFDRGGKSEDKDSREYIEREKRRLLEQYEEREKRERRDKDEVRDVKRDDDRDRDDRRRSKRDNVTIIDDRTTTREATTKPDEPRSDEKRSNVSSLIAADPREEKKKADREARRKQQAETRRMLAEIQKELERERERAKKIAEEKGEILPGTAPRSVVAGASSSKDAATTPGGHVDPFQFQVPDDAFQTPTYATPKRVMTPPDVDKTRGEAEHKPEVILVDREPDFSRPEDRGRERLSRRDEFEQEQRRGSSRQGSRNRSPSCRPEIVTAEPRDFDEPAERSRKRDSEPVPDPIQEEANRRYREEVKERMRSRSASPSGSVVDKYQDDSVTPVKVPSTPPEMHRAAKNKYAEPNADVRIDNVILPRDLPKFSAPPPTPGFPNMVPIFKSRDPSCERERPMLNLVLPTPKSTPSPEKQMAKQRSSEPATKDRDETSSSRKAEIVDVSPPDEPSSSAGSKSVSWGENDTKHYDAGSSPEPESDRSRVGQIAGQMPEEKPKFPLKKKNSPMWGAIATALAARAAAAAAGDKDKDEKKDEGAAEKKTEDDKPRPVIVAEPEAQPIKAEEQSSRDLPSAGVSAGSRSILSDIPDHHLEDAPPPPVGPKPPSPSITSSAPMPGGFGDDIDFTAHVAAGLQSSGFDPNIVIDDATFRRRDSPPTGYQKPHVVTAESDLAADADEWDSPTKSPSGRRRRAKKGSGSPDSWEKMSEPSSQSQREIDPENGSKRQSSDSWDTFATKSVGGESEAVLVSVPESQSQSERSVVEDIPAPAPTVEEATPETPAAEDEWAAPSSANKKKKKKTKKGKQQEETSQSPAWFDAEEDVPEKAEQEKVSVPVDEFQDVVDSSPATPKKSKKKSKRDSTGGDDESTREVTYSTPSSDVSVATSASGKKSKKNRRQSRDDWDIPEQDEPPDRPGEDEFKFVDRDISSVVSDPISKRAGDDDFDSKSVVSLPGGVSSRKKRANGRKNDIDIDFGPTNGNGTGKHDDDKEENSFLANADTFGAGVGLMGTAALAAAAMVAAMGSEEKEEEQVSRSFNATQSGPSTGDLKEGQQLPLEAGRRLSDEDITRLFIQDQAQAQQLPDERPQGRERSISYGSQIVDPEVVVQRVIKPAIDPTWGDLLPLPPSVPPSPSPDRDHHHSHGEFAWETQGQGIEDELMALPALPDSRPATPPEEQRPAVMWERERGHARKKSAHETPIKTPKTPSQTAVPLTFRLGGKSSVPSSPAYGYHGHVRRGSVPGTPTAAAFNTTGSPVAGPSDVGASSSSPAPFVLSGVPPTTPKRVSRPTSWDSSREIKPLYLIEKASSSSLGAEFYAAPEVGKLPALPDSEPPSEAASVVHESPGSTRSSSMSLDDEFHDATSVVQESPGSRSLAEFQDAAGDDYLGRDMPGQEEEMGAAERVILGSGETTPRADTRRDVEARMGGMEQAMALQRAMEGVVRDREEDEPQQRDEAVGVVAASPLLPSPMELELLPPLPESRGASPVQAGGIGLVPPLETDLETTPPAATKVVEPETETVTTPVAASVSTRELTETGAETTPTAPTVTAREIIQDESSVKYLVEDLPITVPEVEADKERAIESDTVALETQAKDFAPVVSPELSKEDTLYDPASAAVEHGKEEVVTQLQPDLAEQETIQDSTTASPTEVEEITGPEMIKEEPVHESAIASEAKVEEPAEPALIKEQLTHDPTTALDAMGQEATHPELTKETNVPEPAPVLDSLEQDFGSIQLTEEEIQEILRDPTPVVYVKGKEVANPDLTAEDVIFIPARASASPDKDFAPVAPSKVTPEDVVRGSTPVVDTKDKQIALPDLGHEETLVAKDNLDEDNKRSTSVTASVAAGAAAGGILAAVMLQDQTTPQINIQELAEDDRETLKQRSHDKGKDLDAVDDFYDGASTIAASEAPTSLFYGSTLLGHDEDDGDFKVPHRFSGVKYWHEHDSPPQQRTSRDIPSPEMVSAVPFRPTEEAIQQRDFAGQDELALPSTSKKSSKKSKGKKSRKEVSWEVEAEEEPSKQPPTPSTSVSPEDTPFYTPLEAQTPVPAEPAQEGDFLATTKKSKKNKFKKSKVDDEVVESMDAQSPVQESGPLDTGAKKGKKKAKKLDASWEPDSASQTPESGSVAPISEQTTTAEVVVPRDIVPSSGEPTILEGSTVAEPVTAAPAAADTDISRDKGGKDQDEPPKSAAKKKGGFMSMLPGIAGLGAVGSLWGLGASSSSSTKPAAAAAAAASSSSSSDVKQEKKTKKKKQKEESQAAAGKDQVGAGAVAARELHEPTTGRDKSGPATTTTTGELLPNDDGVPVAFPLLDNLGEYERRGIGDLETPIESSTTPGDGVNNQAATTKDHRGAHLLSLPLSPRRGGAAAKKSKKGKKKK